VLVVLGAAVVVVLGAAVVALGAAVPLILGGVALPVRGVAELVALTGVASLLALLVLERGVGIAAAFQC
jgi:hypothetical protein